MADTGPGLGLSLTQLTELPCPVVSTRWPAPGLDGRIPRARPVGVDTSQNVGDGVD
ncbi:uncharacterized protein P174DRAFT_443987 [Aspergillus novofumigatus IBT 16806]|uniref:Uncharacterized protein n=1 Tax=Aspergillus novofumigatus (strain IBT 16806) TaxID=1392255 RepID=A0A2I1C2V5_ASPN1|nr:uncharacterized protein P174DRAFT_443987 [Aspergillus novofumigatus IBT 16806]PKX91980.1 hypothetical protein P174DRAFT_443987 [Aspergillus novofumigatus IBT 16806]